jgi:hypothetical protein
VEKKRRVVVRAQVLDPKITMNHHFLLQLGKVVSEPQLEPQLELLHHRVIRLLQPVPPSDPNRAQVVRPGLTWRQDQVSVARPAPTLGAAVRERTTPPGRRTTTRPLSRNLAAALRGVNPQFSSHPRADPVLLLPVHLAVPQVAHRTHLTSSQLRPKLMEQAVVRDRASVARQVQTLDPRASVVRPVQTLDPWASVVRPVPTSDP